MTRLSLTEQYNNKDVLTQLYRVIDIVEHGSIQTVTSTKEGDDVIVSFTMHDGTVHTITFPANGISSIVSRQDGSTMYVDITLNDGTVQTISWTIVPGVTLDTAQTITGAKTFSALGTFLLGVAVTGMSTIDGDLQITNGHNLSVAGDIDAAGALKGDSAEIRGPMSVSGQSEIAGMAIEPNGSATAISNDNGISSDSPLTLTGLVTATNIPTTETGVRDTKPVNGTRLQNDLDAYVPMVRTSGDQRIAGNKTRTGQDVYEKNNYGSNIFKHLSADVNEPTAGERFMGIRFVDKNDVEMVNLRAGIANNGKCIFGGYIRNSDGTNKYFTIVAGD